MFVELLVLLVLLHISFYLISAVVTAVFSVLTATISQTDNPPTDHRLSVANQLIVDIAIGVLLGSTVQHLVTHTNASPDWLYAGCGFLYVSILLTFNWLDKATGVTADSSPMEGGGSEGAFVGAIAGVLTYWLAYTWPDVIQSAGIPQTTTAWLVDTATGLAGSTLLGIAAGVLVALYLAKSFGALFLKGSQYAEGARATVDRIM